MKYLLIIVLLVVALIVTGCVNENKNITKDWTFPDTNFTANITSGTSQIAVQFKDTSANIPTAWSWYFWDNETVSSTDQNPTAIFTTGVYNIRLNASNSYGYNWKNQTAYITVYTLPTPMGKLANNDSYLNIATYDGSYQLVHPCVIYNASGWNGYKYLMAMTPYPNSKSDYENPSMRYSNDGITWVKISGQPDPIIAQPAVGFNNDPNIELNDGTLYLFYRYTNVTEANGEWYNYTTTTNGVTWTTPVTLTMDKTRSSSFIYNGTGWESWGHNTTSNNLTHFTTNDLVTWIQSGTTSIKTTAYPQWHSEVKKYDGQYMLLVNEAGYGGSNSKYMYFYTSPDGLTWTSTNNNLPVLSARDRKWDKSLYKSSFVEMNNKYKVWYGGFSRSAVFKVAYTEYPSNVPVSSNFTQNILFWNNRLNARRM